MNHLTEPCFQNATAARAKLESIRWPNGPVCPHCQEDARRYATKKEGRWRCGNPECRKDFTVTTRTVMESSHIGLHIWLSSFYLMASSKKGISAHQIHRTFGITYKAAWFMEHRIREAMAGGGFVGLLGGAGQIVEADETYHGKRETPLQLSRGRVRKPTKSGKPGGAEKRAIVSLVQRGGSVKSFHVANPESHEITKIVRSNIAKGSRLHTDESRLYIGVGKEFASHETVKHSAKEYARGDVHVNSAEGYFGLFKRGFNGIYQHCREKHLHRYLSEYDFRYNHRVRLGFNDMDRAVIAIRAAEGRRLTYRPIDAA